MATQQQKQLATDLDQYKYGFKTPEDYAFKSGKGLTEKTVRMISEYKKEPQWMLDFRLKAFGYFLEKPMPTWGSPFLQEVDFDDIRYYIKPKGKNEKTWEEVPQEIKDTFDKLGVPQAERKFLAGVGAQFESETVYHSLQAHLEEKGVIFTDTDTAVQKYPELMRKYFATVVPPRDNKLAALNSAVWSGGSFVYVPKGVHIELPLQAYFRINAENAGQFERTLIIADEGSSIHYTEGCFIAGTPVQTTEGMRPIETIQPGDAVFTHKGRYKKVYHTQMRPYSGALYYFEVVGNGKEQIAATKEHPFLIVKRERHNERNKNWKPEWTPAEKINTRDYMCIPIDRSTKTSELREEEVKIGHGRHGYSSIPVSIPLTPEFFRLVGYYLAEGSITKEHYLRFSFNKNERLYIDEVKSILKSTFNIENMYESHHKTNNGTSVVVCSAKLCRIFKQFGTLCDTKKIPQWMMNQSTEKQKQLILGWFRGDGNYYKKKNKHGNKEMIRMCTTSKILALQARQILARLNVAASINLQNRTSTGRKIMYMCVIGGGYIHALGKILDMDIPATMNNRKRATPYYVDDKYLYVPIKKITRKNVKNIPVYNFSVQEDESYTAGGVAVHNCTAPIYSTNSLHSAVVEIIVHKGAKVQYTTVQNWSKNIFNLVTKRAVAHEDATMIWLDCNIGSRLTMKYPAIYLAGRGAHGEILSLAFANKGQHQDAGGKIIHAAPDTSSMISAKSISKSGGRSTYRGLLEIQPGAARSKSRVTCDALLLDDISITDTYPTMKVEENNVAIAHEATVTKISEDQLFYLMSRGLTEQEASNMIVHGFLSPIMKEFPMEYTVELNRLISLEMEGSVG